MSNTEVWPCQRGLDWTQTLKPRWSKCIQALLFQIKKVTVWTKSTAGHPLTASVWYIGKLSTGQEEYGWGGEMRGVWGAEKKEKHIPAYTWEGWAAECCQHVLFTGSWLLFTCGPSERHAELSLHRLRMLPPTEEQRGRARDQTEGQPWKCGFCFLNACS